MRPQFGRRATAWNEFRTVWKIVAWSAEFTFTDQETKLMMGGSEILLILFRKFEVQVNIFISVTLIAINKTCSSCVL